MSFVTFFYVGGMSTLLDCHTLVGMMISVEQGAVTTINTTVNPALNSQQAIYYSGCRPKHPSTTARYA